MSMIGHVLKITAKQLQELIDAPYMIEDVIYVDGVQPSRDSLEIGPNGQDWHLIHYLLTHNATGGSGPLADVIVGGAAIGEDVGYGPVHYLTPDEVKATASALDRISPAVLERRYDADALTLEEIYPGNWNDYNGPPNYLTEAYEELRNYYGEAAKNGNAMLKWID